MILLEIFHIEIKKKNDSESFWSFAKKIPKRKQMSITGLHGDYVGLFFFEPLPRYFKFYERVH